MSRTSLAALVAAALLVPAASAAQAKRPGRDLVRRGEYLVALGGCNDCHTPWRFDPKLGMPVPDMSRRLSGHPAAAPDPAGTYTKPDTGIIGPTFTSFRMAFGTVYAPNLTPDPTGLASYTERQFIRAMRIGRKMGIEGGPPMLPPMPWTALARATDDDLRAIFAYLRSLPSVKNPVPQNKVSPEAIQRVSRAYDEIARGVAAPAARAE
jgi:hypothetical protein